MQAPASATRHGHSACRVVEPQLLAAQLASADCLRILAQVAGFESERRADTKKCRHDRELDSAFRNASCFNVL